MSDNNICSNAYLCVSIFRENPVTDISSDKRVNAYARMRSSANQFTTA